jgi:hypothetical protein
VWCSLLILLGFHGSSGAQPLKWRLSEGEIYIYLVLKDKHSMMLDASMLVSWPTSSFHVVVRERSQLDGWSPPSKIYTYMWILSRFSLFFLPYHIFDNLHDILALLMMSLITPVIKWVVPDSAFNKLYKTNGVHKIFCFSTWQARRSRTLGCEHFCRCWELCAFQDENKIMASGYYSTRVVWLFLWDLR